MSGRTYCAHRRDEDDSVRVVIAMKGGPCTGKTTLARALAKSLRCTLASDHDLLSCLTSDTARFLSTCCPSSTDTLSANHLNDLSYQVLWRVAETQLLRDNSIVVDSTLCTQAHLDRFRALSSSRGKEIVPIIIECRAQDKSGWMRRLSQTCSPEESEKIIVEDQDDGVDTGDIPKLRVDTTSQLGIEEHLRNMENFILSCIDKKLYGDMPNGQMVLDCVDCMEAYIQRITAHLPATLKHPCHEHELALDNVAWPYASGDVYHFHCNGCTGIGRNLHYSCSDHACDFDLHLHAKCALNLPVTINPMIHCGHPLVLTSRPQMRPELCYCDYYLCEQERSPEDWFYFCEECEHHFHIRCVNPEFYDSPDLVEY